MYTQEKPPLAELAHHGIKGMKWGQRKNKSSEPLSGLVKKDLAIKTKNGDVITLSPKAPNALNKAMAKLSKKYRMSYKDSAFLTIKDKKGKAVGHAQLWTKGKDDLYLNYIEVKSSQRGHGYATAILKSAVNWAEANNKKTVTLEVPGIAPDARHIYEKQGFKVIKEPTAKEVSKDPVWRGLTTMQYTTKHGKKEGT